MWPFERDIGRDDIGKRGEKIARKHLRSAGLKILAQNYLCPAGEIDLIALAKSPRGSNSPDMIVFAEVKTRSSDKYTDPESAVNAEKRARMKKAAKYYLTAYRAENFDVRFDVVSILMPEGSQANIKHISDAF